MKRTTIAVVLSLVLVALIAVPVWAAAQKANLVACPINYPAGLAGGGFVIFNNSAGPNNLEITLSLKGAAPNTTFNVYLGVDSWATGSALVGTVTTNKQGNGNFHLNTAVARGTAHVLNIDVATSTGADVFELPGIHNEEAVPATAMGGVTLNFK